MKNSKYVVFCSFLLLCCVQPRVFSQTILYQGVVRDVNTKEPLVGASIVIDNRKDLSSTVSGEGGVFSVSVSPRNHSISVRYVGYVPFSIYDEDGTQNRDFIFEMERVANQLEQVVVTSKGFDKTIRKPILGVTQINMKTLKNLPAAFGEVDILRGIQMLPGVSSVGEASNGVNIRGGTTDQNLILVDDTPIFNPTHIFGLFSVVPPDAVSSLELYKGNVPGRYGGRAASVMDISLKNPTTSTFQANGGISLIANRLMIDTPIIKDKLGIYVAGRGSYTDFLLPLVSDRLEGIKTTFGEVVSKVFWRINDKNTFTATGYFSDDFFQTGLLTNLPNVVGTETYYEHITKNGMARWLHLINDKLDVQTTFSIADYTPTIATVEFDSDNAVELNSRIVQTQAKSNINYQLPRHKFESGVSFTRYQIEPGTLEPNASSRVNRIDTPEELGHEYAWYVDDEFGINDKLSLSFGMRYSFFTALGPSLQRSYRIGEPRDEFSVLDSTFFGKGDVLQSYGGLEPRLGLRYSINEASSCKLGYNLMRQYLQVVSNTTTPIPTSRWKTSDQFIKPQVSQLVTAGYYREFNENIYEFTLEGYYRFTGNIVDYKPGADFLLQPFPETQLVQGVSRAYGVEAMLSKKKGKVTGWVNYTYARTQNRVRTNVSSTELINGGAWYSANFDKPHTFNTSVDIFVDKHNSFGFNFVYSSGRPYTEPVGFINFQNNIYPFYDERNNNRIPDYHRLDFSWNISNPRMKDGKYQGSWAFTVYNLYARQNVYSVFFKTEDRFARAYDLKIFAAPIVSLTYNFKFE